MMKPITAAIIAATIGCTDPKPPPDDPDCTAGATVYMGNTITCADGTGLCVKLGRNEPIECLPLCADGPACADSWQWASIAVSDGPPVCYCEPRPTSHLVDAGPDAAPDAR